MLSSSRFTLVIPTYNRPWLLNGLLAHLAAKHTAFRIVILDSSSTKNQALNREAVARHPLNIEWLGFDENTDAVEKFCSGLSRVETPYTAFCADDDLIFVDSIEACVTELENHARVVACHGLYLNFSPDQRNLDVKIEYSAPSIDSRTVLGRIFQLLANYESLNYAVYRSECLADVLRASIQFKSPIYWELFTCIAPLASGEVTRLNCIYNARRARVVPILPKGDPLRWLCENPDEFFAEFLVYRDHLLSFLGSKGLNLSGDMSTKIAQAHIPYLTTYTRNHDTIVEMVARNMFAEGQTDLPGNWRALHHLDKRRAPGGFINRVANAVRRAKQKLDADNYVELKLNAHGVVARMPVKELPRIPREIVGDLSMYWGKVLEMDPLGAA